MRLRTFTAHDMPAAMTMVREALGEHAIILSTSNKGKGPVTITAAMDADAGEAPAHKPATAKRERAAEPARAILQNNEQADSLRYDLQEALRFHNVPELYIAKIMQLASDKELAALVALQNARASAKSATPDKLLRHGLEKILAGFFDFMPLDFSAAGLRLMLVGPPGIGKTLTVAKIAAKLVMENKSAASDLTIVTTDNKRAGGFEQLQSLTSILGLELQAADSPAELKSILADCKPKSRVLIDTAGCNPYDASEIAELKTYCKLGHIDPVMVLPAGGDSLEAIDIVEAFSVLPIEKLLVTRADTARRFGGIIAAAASHKLAFCQSSSSSSIVDSLHPLAAADLAGLLLSYKTYKH